MNGLNKTFLDKNILKYISEVKTSNPSGQWYFIIVSEVKTSMSEFIKPL